MALGLMPSRFLFPALVLAQIVLVLLYLPPMFGDGRASASTAAAAAAAASSSSSPPSYLPPPPSSPPPLPPSPPPPSLHDAPLSALLQAAWRDYKTAVDAPRITTHDGVEYDLSPGLAPVREPFGRRLLILDMDGRGFEGPDEAWAPGPLQWARMAGTSPGMLNHYAYALIHGYAYRFIRTAKPSWGSPVWAEIPAIKSVLADYDVVVSLDTDAIFPNLNLPFEWLMNRWNLTEDVAFAMANDRKRHPDPKVPTHYDAKGHLRDNPGFLAVRNTPIAFEMLDRWVECPHLVEGCDRFKTSFPAEMGAWSEYVRYGGGSDRYWAALRELPCAEANGFPEQTGECNGVFVRHFTSDKSRLKPAVADSIVHSFFHVLHADMAGRKGDLVRADAVFGAGAALPAGVPV